MAQNRGNARRQEDEGKSWAVKGLQYKAKEFEIKSCR